MQRRKLVKKIMGAGGRQIDIRPGIVPRALNVLVQPNAIIFLVFESRRFRLELELSSIVANHADFTFGKAVYGLCFDFER